MTPPRSNLSLGAIARHNRPHPGAPACVPSPRTSVVVYSPSIHTHSQAVSFSAAYRISGFPARILYNNTPTEEASGTTPVAHGLLML